MYASYLTSYKRSSTCPKNRCLLAQDTNDCADKIQKCWWESQTPASPTPWGLQVSLTKKTGKKLCVKPKLCTLVHETKAVEGKLKMTRGKPCTQLSALSWHLCVTPSNPLHRGWDASPIWFFTVSPHTKRTASCEWSKSVLKFKICILARFTSYLERTEDVLKLLLSSHATRALLYYHNSLCLPWPAFVSLCILLPFTCTCVNNSRKAGLGNTAWATVGCMK